MTRTMPPGENLREPVRRRLANKELFLISRKGHAERGGGNSCAVCALVISTNEIQYTVSGSVKTVSAHRVLPGLAAGVGVGAPARREMRPASPPAYLTGLRKRRMLTPP